MIIFLNGTSSAGKTSIAKKIQEIYPKPILHMGIDHFLFALHPRFIAQGEESEHAYQFISMEDKHGPKTHVHIGCYGKQLSFAMHRTFKLFSDRQIDLIIDDVLFAEEDFQDYLEVFKKTPPYFVAVKPPQHVAESRERARGDRHLGLARGLYDVVYRDKVFDIEIDSSKMTPDESARFLLDYVATHPHPHAFESNRENSLL